MTLSKIIQDIENELSLFYQGGAIRFIDEKYDGAWSKAIDRFEMALNKKDEELWKLEGRIYKTTVLEFIQIYKNSKREETIEDFLKTLGP